MRRRRFPLALAAVIGVPLVPMHVGGWAVTTVDDLPDHVVVGSTVPLAFTIRQHGVEPLAGLQPWVEVRSEGGATARADARPSGKAGHYVASVPVARRGEWRLTIHTDFGRQSVMLPALTALAPGAPAPSISAPERGARLFAAKGCVTCHVNTDVGPRLGGKRFDSTYIARYLADPSITPPRERGKVMPNLQLAPREIASLVAFLNDGKQLSSR